MIPPIAPQDKFLSTGVFSLDLRLGGGFPRGRISIVHGGASSAKTIIGLQTAKQTLHHNEAVLWADADLAYPKPYADAMGLSKEELFFIMDPHQSGKGLDGITDVISTGDFPLVIIDSIPLLLKYQCSLLNNAIPENLDPYVERLASTLRETNTACVMLNQIRDSIYVNALRQPGGKKVQRLAERDVFLRKGPPVVRDGLKVGDSTYCRVDKRTGVPPGKTVRLRMYGKGVDYLEDAVELAADAGILKRSGSWLLKDTQTLGQGVVGACETFSQDSSLQDWLFSSLSQLLAQRVQYTPKKRNSTRNAGKTSWKLSLTL